MLTIRRKTNPVQWVAVLTKDNQLTFADLNIDADLVAALAAHGITEPFPIQQESIPLALAGKDVIGQAKTGTGKTMGFGLPLLQHLGAEPRPGVQALVVAPTRELATQIAEDLEVAAADRPTEIAAIYGGKAYEGQIEQLKSGAQVVVGTPGRLLDLKRQHILDLSKVEVVVLDEADKMLDLGFLPDVEAIFQSLPPVHQTLLFSATMPGPVLALARRFMTQPIHIRISDPNEGQTQANIEQFVYRTHQMDKDEVIGRILLAEGRGKTVIFTRTKRAAARLAEELSDRGFKATAVHGDLNQAARERNMNLFRNGKVEILVATDVAARGIDVDDVTHVINHTIPEDEKDYLHRIGRTGRAGKHGTAVTFVDWEDTTRWSLINKALDFGQPEPTETYSTSPHLFADLHIPEDAKGRLVPEHKQHKQHRDQDHGHGKGGNNRNRRTRHSDRGRDNAREQRARDRHRDENDRSSDQPQGAASQATAGDKQSANGQPRRRRRRRTNTNAPQAHKDSATNATVAE